MIVIPSSTYYVVIQTIGEFFAHLVPHVQIEERLHYDVLFREEIDYIMMCVDANQDGKVDFLEFTERFHNPAKDIGFNVALLLTNLAEHMPNDPRLVFLKF